VPTAEKGAKAYLRAAAGYFLQSELREQLTKLRPFREILRRSEPAFSVFQTGWRRGRDSPRPVKIKAKPLVLRIGLEFSQLYWGLFSAILGSR
jgi:hypothetical protein